MPEADEQGRVNLTLPTEGGKVMAGAVRERSCRGVSLDPDRDPTGVGLGLSHRDRENN